VAEYAQGQPVTLTGEVTDPATGAHVDAGTIKLVVHKPDGTALPDYTTPARDGLGLYSQVIPAADTTQLGYYPRSWVTTGTGAGVTQPGGFTIIDPFEILIATLDEARAALGYGPDETSDDDELRRLIRGITPVVEDYKNEVMTRRSFTDEFDLCGRWQFWLRHTPVASLTSMVSIPAGTTWDVANMHVTAASGRVRILNGLTPTGLVAVAYAAGPTVVPENYKQGALTALQWLWETQRGVGSSPSAVVGPNELDPRALIAFPAKMKDWFGPPRGVYG
jgi:hypothetical protein